MGFIYKNDNGKTTIFYKALLFGEGVDVSIEEAVEAIITAQKCIGEISSVAGEGIGII